MKGRICALSFLKINQITIRTVAIQKIQTLVVAFLSHAQRAIHERVRDQNHQPRRSTAAKGDPRLVQKLIQLLCVLMAAYHNSTRQTVGSKQESRQHLQGAYQSKRRKQCHAHAQQDL